MRFAKKGSIKNRVAYQGFRMISGKQLLVITMIQE